MEGTLNILPNNPSKSSRSCSTSTFAIDIISGDPFMQAEPTSQGSIKSTSLSKKHKYDKLILGFQYHENVDGTPNEKLLLIIIDITVNHFVSRILIDDESYCNQVYFGIFTKLDLRKQKLWACEVQSLIVFNDSSPRPCGHVCILVS